MGQPPPAITSFASRDYFGRLETGPLTRTWTESAQVGPPGPDHDEAFMEKRILDAEKKVNNFYFLANKNLLRAAKKWLGVRKLNLAKQAKAAAQSKEKGVAATAQIETLKRITPAMLSTSGLLRLQIFEHNNRAAKLLPLEPRAPKRINQRAGRMAQLVAKVMAAAKMAGPKS